jgi:hypothetical protein
MEASAERPANSAILRPSFMAGSSAIVSFPDSCRHFDAVPSELFECLVEEEREVLQEAAELSAS